MLYAVICDMLFGSHIGGLLLSFMAIEWVVIWNQLVSNNTIKMCDSSHSLLRIIIQKNLKHYFAWQSFMVNYDSVSIQTRFNKGRDESICNLGAILLMVSRLYLVIAQWFIRKIFVLSIVPRGLFGIKILSLKVVKFLVN